jgi:hypothetical protein
MNNSAYLRSPKALLGGIAHLERFIDKIRVKIMVPGTIGRSHLRQGAVDETTCGARM